MSICFTPDELTEIREFINAIEHTVPIPCPAPDHKRLPVTVILHDAMGDVAASAYITGDDSPRITFPSSVKGDQLRTLLTGTEAGA